MLRGCPPTPPPAALPPWGPQRERGAAEIAQPCAAPSHDAQRPPSPGSSSSSSSRGRPACSPGAAAEGRSEPLHLCTPPLGHQRSTGSKRSPATSPSPQAVSALYCLSCYSDPLSSSRGVAEGVGGCPHTPQCPGAAAGSELALKESRPGPHAARPARPGHGCGPLPLSSGLAEGHGLPSA